MSFRFVFDFEFSDESKEDVDEEDDADEKLSLLSVLFDKAI
jgi:hypothetical protein